MKLKGSAKFSLLVKLSPCRTLIYFCLSIAGDKRLLSMWRQSPCIEGNSVYLKKQIYFTHQFYKGFES